MANPPRIVCAICKLGPMHGKELRKVGPGMWVCVGGHPKRDRRAIPGLAEDKLLEALYGAGVKKSHVFTEDKNGT